MTLWENPLARSKHWFFQIHSKKTVLTSLTFPHIPLGKKYQYTNNNKNANKQIFIGKASFPWGGQGSGNWFVHTHSKNTGLTCFTFPHIPLAEKYRYKILKFFKQKIPKLKWFRSIFTATRGLINKCDSAVFAQKWLKNTTLLSRHPDRFALSFFNGPLRHLYYDEV